MNQLNIAITGEAPVELKNLASNVVYEALVAHGFTDVGIVDAAGDIADHQDTPTLLDWVRRHDARLLDIPVTVINSAYTEHNAIISKDTAGDIVANSDGFYSDSDVDAAKKVKSMDKESSFIIDIVANTHALNADEVA